MTGRVRLDHDGIAAIAKSAEIQALVEAAAEQVAAHVREQGIKVGDHDGGKHEKDLPVKVETDITDRARATVVIAHPSGVAVQAKHGALTRAASATGLKVKGGG